MLNMKTGEYSSFEILFCSRLKVNVRSRVVTANMNWIVGDIYEIILFLHFIIVINPLS